MAVFLILLLGSCGIKITKSNSCGIKISEHFGNQNQGVTADIKHIQSVLGYRFVKISNLTNALADSKIGNLHWIGNEILNFTISKVAYSKFGEFYGYQQPLNDFKTKYINNAKLSNLARNILKIKHDNASVRDIIYGNIMEAIFGAIMHDSSQEEAAKVILRVLEIEVGDEDQWINKDVIVSNEQYLYPIVNF